MEPVRKVITKDDVQEDAVIHAAEFDGLDRRLSKTVTNAGNLDGTYVHLYDGYKTIEIRDGSENSSAKSLYASLRKNGNLGNCFYKIKS